MPSQSEIARDGIIMHPHNNIAKEINVEPIYKFGDDFYQRTVNQYNKPYFKLLKRYGNNPWYTQAIYIMIEKRNNEHIEETINQYAQQMKELSDSISHYPFRNFTEAEVINFRELKEAINFMQSIKFNQYGQYDIKCEVNCIDEFP